MTTRLNSRSFRLSLLVACQFVLAIGCEGELSQSVDTRPAWLPLLAYCEVDLPGVGLVDVETDYLPHVVQCENGAADFEALKAQAIAARSYLYYKLDGGETIEDGQKDQVYSCGRTPLPEHVEAVQQTAGQVMVYDNVTICAFYVAGAIPSADDCVAAEGDPDLYNTERFVTYNWGLFGEDVIQSSLGYVHPDNAFNRGCKSQNGANCLSENGWGYVDILKFYYGMDFRLEKGEGQCIFDTGDDTDQDTDPGPDLDTDGDLSETDTRDENDTLLEDNDLENEDYSGTGGASCHLMESDLSSRCERFWLALLVLL